MKRRSTRNNSRVSRNPQKNRRSKHKNSKKFKDKLEIHSKNPLYTYLICVTCLRSWRKFSEESEEMPEPTINVRSNPTWNLEERKEKTEKNTLNSALNSATIPISQAVGPRSEEAFEQNINPYIVVPNYIMDNP